MIRFTRWAAAGLLTLFCTGAAPAQQTPQTPYPMPRFPGMELPVKIPGWDPNTGVFQIPGIPQGLLPNICGGQLRTGSNIFSPSPYVVGPHPANLDPPRPLPGQPVDEYNCMQVEGRPCRVPRETLPLKVYAPLAAYRDITQQSMDKWNAVGLTFHVRFFEQVESKEEAQIVVDWTGTKVPPKADGITFFRVNSASLEVNDVGIRDHGEGPNDALIEVLAHEFGHCLGLDHSAQASDLMYAGYTGKYAKPDAKVSPRDAWILSWLYTQQTIVPIRCRSIY